MSTAKRAAPPLVFLDLEGTGLPENLGGRMPDIVQIAAATRDGHNFDRYVMPEQAMTPSAVRITGRMRVEGDVMRRHGKPLTTVGIRRALKDWLHWLQEVSERAGGGKPVLMAYSGDKYDFPVLRTALRNCGLAEEAKSTIGGCVDVFKIVKARIPRREVGNFKLSSLAHRFLGSSLDAHDALADVTMLRDVYDVRLAATSLVLYTRPFL